MYGRHFDDQDEVVSLITRNSIDVLKTVFRDEVAKEDWQLIVKLKAMLEVM
jgi:translation initiation factor 5B